MNPDKETDGFCGALLSEIAKIDPRLSQQVTKRISRSAKLTGDKRQRKFAKVAVFYKEYNNLYQTAIKRLSRLPEWSSPASDPKISTFYESVYALLKLEPVPGSFESKYDYTQKPIPD